MQGSNIVFYLQDNTGKQYSITYLTNDLPGELGVAPNYVWPNTTNGFGGYITEPYFKNFTYDSASQLGTNAQLNAQTSDPNSPYYNSVQSTLYVGNFANETINLQNEVELLFGDSGATGFSVTGFSVHNYDSKAQLTIGGMDFYNSTNNARTAFETAQKNTLVYYDKNYSEVSGDTLQDAENKAMHVAMNYAS